MCWSRLWSGHKVRFSQLRHRVPYTMFFFGFGLWCTECVSTINIKDPPPPLHPPHNCLMDMVKGATRFRCMDFEVIFCECILSLFSSPPLLVDELLFRCEYHYPGVLFHVVFVRDNADVGLHAAGWSLGGPRRCTRLKIFIH
jgi:hypothetical protein